MEEWKQIEGYDNYEVSTFGNVRNKTTQRLLKIKNNSNGYLYYALYKNNIQTNKFIHRLIGDAFIENPENKKYIDHKDNNPQNNNISNLRWVTAHENVVRQLRMKNSKNIYWIERKQHYRILYKSNGHICDNARKKLEEAEALLAEWKRLYPHNII